MSEKQNIEFALFMEQYPCLYDHTSKQYSNKIITEKAWNEVAARFQMTVKDAKARWKNIRTVFRRHLFTNPSSGSVGVKKEYYLNDVLQYLIPILEGKKKYVVTNLPSPSTWDENNDESHDLMPEDSMNDAEADDTPVTCVTEFRHEVNRNKRKSKSPLDDAMVEYFRNTSNAPSGHSTLTSDEKFLLSLTDDMKEMNTFQKRQFKRRIYEVIDDIMGEGSSRINSCTGTLSSASSQ